jgi:hypothetical protein
MRLPSMTSKACYDAMHRIYVRNILCFAKGVFLAIEEAAGEKYSSSNTLALTLEEVSFQHSI